MGPGGLGFQSGYHIRHQHNIYRMVLSGCILPLLGRFHFPQTKAGTTYSVQFSFLYLCSAEPGSIVWFTSRLYCTMLEYLAKTNVFLFEKRPPGYWSGSENKQKFLQYCQTTFAFWMQNIARLWRLKTKKHLALQDAFPLTPCWRSIEEIGYEECGLACFNFSKACQGQG